MDNCKATMKRRHCPNPRSLLVVLCLLVTICDRVSSLAFSPSDQSRSTNISVLGDACSRRSWFQKILLSSSRIVATTTATTTAALLVLPMTPPANAINNNNNNNNNPLPELLEAQTTLTNLLENWKRATVDCTFADVPRELLEQKNKELLLEKASTFALFDKSVSVESCKTTNRIVRDYLGVTGKGPMVGMDKKLKRGLDYLDDVDDLDLYVTELEKFSQACSRASSLSYTAGVVDLTSVNNFSKEEADDGSADNANSNLNQAKAAIGEAKLSLDKLIVMLQEGQS